MSRETLIEIIRPAQKFLIAGAAAFALAIPATANAGSMNVSFDGLDFDDDEDVLEQLIELDADDIDEIREEMADARQDIAEAIIEIEEARLEASDVPGGGAIVSAALKTASVIVSKAANEAFDEVEEELDDAERELDAVKSDLADGEYAETTMAIGVIREEIASMREALSDLVSAMRA